MKDIKFYADKITYEINTEENYYMISFSDNGDEPVQYVILQRAIIFDEQDIELEMNTYYFEYSDQSISGYDVCENVNIETDKVLFAVKRKVFDDIETIEVAFEQEKSIDDWNKFKDIFDKIFSNK
jgi:hypothetical protein